MVESLLLGNEPVMPELEPFTATVGLLPDCREVETVR
jgi:hypothetical protein